MDQIQANAVLAIVPWRNYIDVIGVERGLMGMRLALMERVPHTPGAVSQISRHVTESGLVPQLGVLTISRVPLLLKALSFPAVAADSLTEVIGFEADKHVPLAQEERRLSWQRSAALQKGQLPVLLLAARNDAVREETAEYLDANVPIDRALPLSVALAPAFGKGSTLLLILDDDCAEVAVCMDGFLLESRTLQGANVHSAEAVSGLVQETVAACMRSLGEDGVSTVYCLGPQEMPEGLADQLSADFGVRPKDANALMQQFLPRELDEEEIRVPEAATLCALLMRAEAGTADLLQRAPRKRRRQYAPAVGLTLGVLTVLLMMAWVVLDLAHLRKAKSAYEDEINRLTEEVAQVDEDRDVAAALRARIQHRQDKLAGRVSVLAILQDVTDGLDKDSYLTHFSLSGGTRISLNGWSQMSSEIPARLESQPTLKEVSFPRETTKRDDYHRFSLSAVVEMPEQATDKKEAK